MTSRNIASKRNIASNTVSLEKLNRVLDEQLKDVTNIKLIIRYTDGIKAWEFTEMHINNRKAFLLELFKLSEFIYAEINNSTEQSKPILIQSISNYNPFTIKDFSVMSILNTRKLLKKHFKKESACNNKIA